MLDLLEGAGWLSQTLGTWQNGEKQRTALHPSQRLLNRISQTGFTLADIGRSKDEEVLILKSAKEDYWTGGEYILYAETDETNRIREQLRVINEGIAKANIEFDVSVVCRPDVYINPYAKTLRRHFTCSSFNSGGRLFGGFWQSLTTEERLEGLTIEGEPVVYLDYGQMAVRILYGLARASVPEGDLYRIPGIGEEYRAGVKLLFNSLTFIDHEPTRKPKDSKDKLPDMDTGDIVSLIRQAHPNIAHYFGTMIGHKCQHLESEVMIEVMSRLRQDNIIALPVHDALVVQCSAQGLAERVMTEVFENMVGV